MEAIARKEAKIKHTRPCLQLVASLPLRRHRHLSNACLSSSLSKTESATSPYVAWRASPCCTMGATHWAFG